MVIADGSESAVRLKSSGNSPVISLPVINWMRLALSLLVKGIPASAAAAKAEEMPGIIS